MAWRVAEVGHHLRPSPWPDVAHDLAGLRRAVDPVRLARRGVDLRTPSPSRSPTSISWTNVSGSRSSSSTLDAAARARADDGHHALVVRGHRELALPVAVEVGDLRVAHAAELAAEVGFPERLGRVRPVRAPPELERRPPCRRASGSPAPAGGV